ncbi:phytoene desaturase family protein [Alkalicoccobacillus murimartini]|uniref:4,4'-diaponeurosporene oxygenase n=1 Tax=Alkalicoccobacillus murimartini TaxID=171685 RepID=A0ABT9YDP9_9BACI|nr:phytoene desaturase family protein [Alkalicoccobacillus murimartini]MDQ0205753.1 phytoene desaturase [Alkalicoccobacillus murimartini]
MKSIVIIGGGLAGLSSAISLASKGFNVKLYEKNSHLGGKMRRYQVGNASFDFGPNTMTMPEVFNRVIRESGAEPEDYFRFKRLDTHTRNHFADGTYLDMTADQEQMKQNLSAFGITASMYDRYLHEVNHLYKLSTNHFFPRTFTNWTDYLSPSLSKALLQVHPLLSLDAFHRRFFQHANIVQMLNRYATYIGSSPFLTPATFSMIAYLELIQGVYYVEGGNPTIAEGFSKRALELGVELHCNMEVVRIQTEDKRAKGVELSDGSLVSCNHVIINGDLLKVFPDLVEEKSRPSFTDQKRDKLEPSISAFVILASLNTRMSELIHHQVYFSSNYQREFDEQFSQKKYSEHPTIYISNSSYTDASVSPDGDNLFILVNAPALNKQGDDAIDLESYKRHIYNVLTSYGLDLTPHIIEDQIITPSDIENDYYAYRGALYGVSANTKKTAFLRPANRARDLTNVYFVGGSTHPGGGSPMVVLSGLNVAELVSNIM